MLLYRKFSPEDVLKDKNNPEDPGLKRLIRAIYPQRACAPLLERDPFGLVEDESLLSPVLLAGSQEEACCLVRRDWTRLLILAGANRAR